MAPSTDHEVIEILDDDSPPLSPAKSIRMDENGVILLLSDSEEEGSRVVARKKNQINGAKPVASRATTASQPSASQPSKLRYFFPTTSSKKRAAPSSTGAHTYAGSLPSSAKRAASTASNDPLDRKPAAKLKIESENTPNQNQENRSNQEDEVELVCNSARILRDDGASVGNTADDDCQVVGSTGFNALADFPHSRENCVVFKMSSDPGANMKHCDNCYCYCCDAPAKDCPQWASHCQARHGDSHWQRLRNQWKNQSTSHTPFAMPSTTLTASSSNSRHRTFPHPHASQRSASSKSYSVAELLKSVTAVYPSEVTPPPIVKTTLKHYQKQSLAFMQDVEKNIDASTVGRIDVHPHVGTGHYNIVGGWLSSEVGMGKTLTVIALVASDRGQVLPFLKPNVGNPNLERMTKLKATVVVTSVSLMGQWEDEVKKHAPELSCYRFHSTRSKTSKRLDPACDAMMKDADIIVTSGTFNVFMGMKGIKYVFNRLVIDEAHLLGTSSMRKETQVRSLLAERRWCVTATPCVSSVNELMNQLYVIGQNEIQILSVLRQLQGKETFSAAVSLLKKFMSRHTKDQRINGRAALALPASSTETVTVSMTPNDFHMYQQAMYHISSYTLSEMQQRGAKTATFELRVAHALLGIQSPTKIGLLISDLQQLRLSEPNLRVVIFTQYKATFQRCISELAKTGIMVSKFSGSTSAKHRDEAIRSFQSAGMGPRAFVVTLPAGSVGMTLTAATRVYLMEPCINPATEVQAAGRIHRLGQTSNVTVIKYVFDNLFEQNIIKFHSKIASGEASFTDDFIPPESMRILTDNMYNGAVLTFYSGLLQDLERRHLHPCT